MAAETMHGVPGHDRGTASARIRLGVLVDSPTVGRAWDRSSEGPWEVICVACGDDPSRNYDEVPPEVQAIRGPYSTDHGARVALAEHIGARGYRPR
jgi:hypothetical protein